MTGHDEDSDAGLISEIVEADEQKALARLRSSGFADRLRSSLGGRPEARPRRARVRLLLRPVLASLAMLVVLAAAAVWLLRPPTPSVRREMAGAFLRGLPGLEAIENPRPSPGIVLGSPGSPLERDIASVLSGSAGTSGRPHSGRSPALPAPQPRPQPLGLERVYEILVIDRSVERVLTGISPRTKEG